MVAVIVVIALAIVVVAILTFRPALAKAKGGGILVLLAIFVLPVLAFVFGATSHLEASKQTDFCLSCHAMKPYGESLKIDDRAYIPAVHAQNNLIPADQACYTCHTDYTMFGGVKVKLQGLKHFAIQYFGRTPEQITLYQPFQNRNCLHCHDGARSFVEFPLHESIMVDLQSNDLSCIECHPGYHDVAELASKPLWERSAQ